MKVFKIVLILFWMFVAIPASTKSRKPGSKSKSELLKLLKRKQITSRTHRHDEKKAHQYITSKEAQGLERRFETIKNLGDIINCRLHNEETVVTGNFLICDGKKSKITPEAAEDVEEPGVARQGIMMSPSGAPQDVTSTLQKGLYGQPIASFLGETYGTLRSSNLEPHNHYPFFGIFDPGMRRRDPKFTGRANIFSMSLDNNGGRYDSINDLYNGQTRTMAEPRNFGKMELNDISKTMQDDENSDDFSDHSSMDESFYRDAEAQQKSFEAGQSSDRSNNPFAQYWRSLKSSFYDTTTSQLGEQDPSANSHDKIYEGGETRTKIATKKSSIMTVKGPVSRDAIPTPGDKNKASTKGIANKTTNDKRYFIYGQNRYPIGMYAGVPTYNPWQYPNQQQQGFVRSLGPSNRIFDRQLLYQYMPRSWNQEPAQQGVARSWNQEPAQQGVARSWNQEPPQQGVARSFGPFGPSFNQGWGQNYDSPRPYDPYLAGGPSREPLDTFDTQMRSQHFDGGPGHPRQAEMQYGIQPNTRPPFLGYVPVPIMEAVPMNSFRNNIGNEYGAGHEGLGNEENIFGTQRSEFPETQGFARSNFAREDASQEFKSMSDPQSYLPAPFYRSPTYDPHESEDFFPDGTSALANQQQDDGMKQYSYGLPVEQTKGGNNNEENAAELYENNINEENEQEEKKKRGSGATHLDIHGNKLDTDPDGKFIFTKNHVGFGPITVEAKTANSNMKDPKDDDDDD